MGSLVKSIVDIETVESETWPEQQLPASTYELLCQTAGEHGDRDAIRFIPDPQQYQQSIVYSYRQLLQKIHQVANLMQDLGVANSDVVSLLLPNLPETHFCLWGGSAAGVVNPINPLLEADIIQGILQAANSKVLVTLGPVAGSDIWDKVCQLRQQLPELTVITVLADGFEQDIRLEASYECYEDQRLLSGRHILPDDVATLFHTGGTTGIPKLVRQTHRNQVSVSYCFNLLSSFQPGDNYLVGLPLFHCNAAIGTGLMAFQRACGVVLVGAGGFRTPGALDNFYRMIEHYRAVTFSAVPTIYAALVQQGKPEEDLTSLQFAICGAAPMPVELFERFQALTGIRILEGYGLTETAVVASVNPAGSPPKIGSVGIRLPYTQIGIARLKDNKVTAFCGTNEIGHILVQGPHVTPGYLDPHQNKDVFVEDAQGASWLNTGDLGRLDDDAFLWITGRAKEVIIRGGHNIDPNMIESVIQGYEGVSLAAAVGRPDAYAGEVPVVYVTVTDPALDVKSLMAYAIENIPERAAIPKEIMVLDQMPVTAVGKIFKPKLSWWQIESVYAQVLHNDDYGVMIRVDQHPIHGVIVDIAVKTELTQRETVEIDIQSRVSDYAYRYQVSWRDDI